MDLAANFNNIGVQLHRLQRYKEAEEMFKDAVQVLLHYKSTLLLRQQQKSQREAFDALVDDGRIIRQSASSKADDDKATTMSSPSSHDDDDDVDMLRDIRTQETFTTSPMTTVTSYPSSQDMSLLMLSSSSTPVHQEDLQQEAPQEGGSPEPQILLPQVRQPSLFASLSPSVFGDDDEQMTPPFLRSQRDDFSAYMCVDAIQLDASASSKRDSSTATTTASSSSSTLDSRADDDEDLNDICRYDFETIVVLYNMALTLQCLDQLTLSCYIYDLADRVLCGQPKEMILKDHRASKLVLAICNNLGQIFMEMGHWEMARAYVNRLADFLLTMDPPDNAEQANERLELVLNIYWFDNPPSAAAA